MNCSDRHVIYVFTEADVCCQATTMLWVQSPSPHLHPASSGHMLYLPVPVNNPFAFSRRAASICHGRATVPRGRVMIPLGRVTVLRGRVTVPRGWVNTSEWPSNGSAWPSYGSHGRVTVPRVRATVPRGRDTVPRVQVTVPRGRVTVPRGRVTVPRGRAMVPRIQHFPECSGPALAHHVVLQTDVIGRVSRCFEWVVDIASEHRQILRKPETKEDTSV